MVVWRRRKTMWRGHERRAMVVTKTARVLNDFLLNNYSGASIYCRSQRCSSSQINTALKSTATNWWLSLNSTNDQGVTVVLKQSGICFYEQVECLAVLKHVIPISGTVCRMQNWAATTFQSVKQLQLWDMVAQAEERWAAFHIQTTVGHKSKFLQSRQREEMLSAVSPLVCSIADIDVVLPGIIVTHLWEDNGYRPVMLDRHLTGSRLSPKVPFYETTACSCIQQLERFTHVLVTSSFSCSTDGSPSYQCTIGCSSTLTRCGQGALTVHRGHNMTMLIYLPGN